MTPIAMVMLEPRRLAARAATPDTIGLTIPSGQNPRSGQKRKPNAGILDA